MVTLIKNLFIIFLLAGQTLFSVCVAASNLSKKEFLQLAFPDIENPQATLGKTLWLDKSIQQKIEPILDHQYPKLRLNYWQKSFTNRPSDTQTVWVLDEIGKEQPITFAISIKNDQVTLIRVLKFRESRGGEIQMLAFSDQFEQVALDDNLLLNKNIDGITGATMSVNAMKKITRLALMLHQHVVSQESAL